MHALHDTSRYIEALYVREDNYAEVCKENSVSAEACVLLLLFLYSQKLLMLLQCPERSRPTAAGRSGQRNVTSRNEQRYISRQEGLWPVINTSTYSISGAITILNKQVVLRCQSLAPGKAVAYDKHFSMQFHVRSRSLTSRWSLRCQSSRARNSCGL